MTHFHKQVLTLSVLLTLGAGCAPAPAANTAANTPPASAGNQAASAPANTPSSTPPGTSAPANASAGLTALPYAAPTQPIEDDSNWSVVTTHGGLTLTYPEKGPDAPMWTVAILQKDDAHVQNGCYVTDATMYKKTDGFDTFTNGGCLTTTSFSAETGTRTDYFVTGTTLLTFTKAYSTGFDQNMYTAILLHIIGIID